RSRNALASTLYCRLADLSSRHLRQSPGQRRYIAQQWAAPARVRNGISVSLGPKGRAGIRFQDAPVPGPIWVRPELQTAIIGSDGRGNPLCSIAPSLTKFAYREFVLRYNLPSYIA